ncbi:MAG: UDP-N-acetylmuramoylalanine--D-glutamate ligase [Rhodomicrobium sp.]|nr:MAG: UDP-N-acetylmuramoylalanine--D-glutamate ligase [Rhodomicrobium sp.]
MIPITAYESKRVAVFGLGISGFSAAAALTAGGAAVIVYDDTEARLNEAVAKGFVVSDLKTADWSQIDALVLSPGVPLTHPKPHWVVEKARAAFVPVIGDTELFFSEYLLHNTEANTAEANTGDSDVSPSKTQADQVIVITGTNGKSTTTALTTHILQEAGERAVMGGNIGFGVLDMPQFGEGHIYVLELSSYQIDLTPSLKPTAAGLLNISPDHIDRHGTVENYAAVKARIFDQLSGGVNGGDELPSGLGVLSVDDSYCRMIAHDMPPGGRFQFVSSEAGIAEGAVISEQGFQLIEGGVATREFDLTMARSLRGRHNAQNAAFAFLLARAVTENHEGLVAGLLSFPGLAHRMQEVGSLFVGDRRVLFINDSKATNAEASQQALKSFDDIYWIAGGRAKEGGIESLIPHLGAVRQVFLIGEAAEMFAETLDEAGIAYEICGEMDTAVTAALRAAVSADISSEMVADGFETPVNEVAVLLSPAAASFDQYPNFEVRGGAFSEIVSKIKDVTQPGEGG